MLKKLLLNKLPIVMLIGLLSISMAYSQNDWLQSQSFGGNGNDIAFSIDVDADGNSYVLGGFFGQLDFGNGLELNSQGNRDIFLVKIDILGEVQWAVSAGGASNDDGNKVTVDGDGNIYIAGIFRGTADFDENTSLTSLGAEDIFVAKYNSNGELQWAERYGSTDSDYCNSITSDSDGNLYIFGSYFNETIIGFNKLNTVGFQEIYLAELDATDGSVNWANGYNCAEEFDYSEGMDVVKDNTSGDIYVTGFFAGTIDFTQDISITSDGFNGDVYIAKFNSTGTPQWARSAGSGENGYNITYAIDLDASGNAFITGTFDNTLDLGDGITIDVWGVSDMFLAKYNNQGVTQWAVVGGSTANADYGRDVTIDRTTGDVYVIGLFKEKASFGVDGEGDGILDIFAEGGDEIFLAKYDNDGAFSWAIPAGGLGNDLGTGVKFGAEDLLYVTGTFNQSFDFNENISANHIAGVDFFAAKYGPVLPAPSVVEPADEDVDVAIENVLIDWSDVNDADSYSIQISTSDLFEEENITVDLSGLNNSQYTVLSLDYGTQYFVRFKSVNQMQIGPWSEVYSFTTLPILPPNLVAPADESTNVPRDLTLEWTEVPEADSYRIQVSQAGDFIFVNVQEPVYDGNEYVLTASQLELDREYFWRVRSESSNGHSEYSEVFSFTTVALEAPVATYPLDNSTRIPLEFSLAWDAAETADSYDIQLGTQPDLSGTLIVNETGFNGTSYLIAEGSLEYETVYYYRLRSKNASFTSEYTPIYSFTTTPESEIQDVDLMKGWNLVSLFVDPLDPAMPDVFSDIANNIVVVRDGSLSYIPSFDLNNIGDWNVLKAYRVFARNATTLSVEGAGVVPEDTDIILSTGWNEVAYLRTNNLDAALATQNIGSSLVIVKDDNRGSYIPSLNFNSIGDMEPGEGYQIYVSQTTMFNYPANQLEKASVNRAKTLLPVALTPDFDRTGNTSTIIIDTDLEKGIEIGIYSQAGKLLGSGVVQENGFTAINIFGDNNETDLIDGAKENEELIARAYNNQSNLYAEVKFENVTDIINNVSFENLTYKQDALFQAKGTANFVETNFTVSPNPLSSQANLEYSIEQTSDVEINLIDLSGRNLLEILPQQEKSAGNFVESFDVSNLSNGTYYIDIRINGASNVVPVQIVR